MRARRGSAVAGRGEVRPPQHAQPPTLAIRLASAEDRLDERRALGLGTLGIDERTLNPSDLAGIHAVDERLEVAPNLAAVSVQVPAHVPRRLPLPSRVLDLQNHDCRQAGFVVTQLETK